MKLDKTDFSILAELDKNARVSIAALSKRLRINRDTVKYRIRKLEREKVIDEYYAVIDFSKLEYLFFRLYLSFQHTTKEIEQEIIDYFLDNSNVMKVYETEAKWDLATGLFFESQIDYLTFMRDFKKRFKQYIRSYESALMIELVHYYKNYLSGKNKDFTSVVIGGSKPVKVENIKLLRYISDKARHPLTDIAHHFSTSVNTIKNQLKKFQKDGVILVYRAKINHEKIGREYYKVDIILKDTSIIQDLQRFAKNHDCIIFEDRTTSSSDFEFNVEVENNEELSKIIDEIKSKFPEKVAHVSYYKNKKSHKYHYVIKDAEEF